MKNDNVSYSSGSLLYYSSGSLSSYLGGFFVVFFGWIFFLIGGLKLKTLSFLIFSVKVGPLFLDSITILCNYLTCEGT